MQPAPLAAQRGLLATSSYCSLPFQNTTIVAAKNGYRAQMERLFLVVLRLVMQSNVIVSFFTLPR
jgi:hypothetical protein